ncbi:MAG: alpha/beta hydrolase [Opitutaceae bacterium]|jgi:acetyl esterase/lipase
MKLWPGIAPGEKSGSAAGPETTKPAGYLTGGRPVAILGNVSEPTLTVYRAPADKDTGAAVVVFPGGGYYVLAWDLEGTEACEWLNSIGVTGVLVKYRVPRREGLPPYAAPLQDAQRAVGMVRSHAKEWGLDPKRIGAMGFSAGGNLCAVLSRNSVARTYPRVDASDEASCRPDFQLLIYPAYLVPDSGGYTIVPEAAVTGATPPTFLVMAEDDPIHVENVLGYAMALKEAKVPMELHVYPIGGHGYGLRPTKNPLTSWPQRAADWLKSRGLLDRG